MQLTPGSEAYDTWLNPPAPIYVNFYFFTVTNAKQFVDKQTRPHVRQQGPYVYQEVRNKTEVELINAGATLRYRQHKWYLFDANRSSGSEDDVITTINIPLVVSDISSTSRTSVIELLSLLARSRRPTVTTWMTENICTSCTVLIINMY